MCGCVCVSTLEPSRIASQGKLQHSCNMGGIGCLLSLVSKTDYTDSICFPCCYCVYSRWNQRRVSRRRRDPADTSTPSRNLHLPHRTQHDLNRADVWGGGVGPSLVSWVSPLVCTSLHAAPPTAEESEPKSLHIISPPPPRVASSQHLITRAASDADSVCSVLRLV